MAARREVLESTRDGIATLLEDTPRRTCSWYVLDAASREVERLIADKVVDADSTIVERPDAQVIQFPRFPKVARYLGISPVHVERWAAGEKIPRHLIPQVEDMVRTAFAKGDIAAASL